MEKIDTDYKLQNWKQNQAKLFKPFNRDIAPLRYVFIKAVKSQTTEIGILE